MSTGIGWTDETVNSGVGCDPVSAGCDHCYPIPISRVRAANPNPQIAEAFAGVVHRRPDTGALAWTGRVNLLPHRLPQVLRWRRPRRIFMDSMFDLFHHGVPIEHRALVWAYMSLARRHTFQILTKRPGVLRSNFTSPEFRGLVEQRIAELVADTATPLPASLRVEVRRRAATGQRLLTSWPLPNLWLGTSDEDQSVTFRLDALLAAPAAVHMVSVEPLLGAVHLSRHLLPAPTSDGARLGLSCVIVGGESGPGARRMEEAWAADVVAQAAAADVPVFFKQAGTALARDWGARGKGDDPAGWPRPWPQQFPRPRPDDSAPRAPNATQPDPPQ